VSAPTNAPAPDPAASIAAPPAGAPGDRRKERWRFAIYAGHLLTLFGIALSNALLALSLLTYPFLGDRDARAVRRGRTLLLVAAAYVVLLLVSIAMSRDRGASVAALREIFTLAALPLALAVVKGERRLRWLFDALILVAAALALFGLAQFLFGYGSIDRRIRGPFSHVMTFSGLLLLIDLLLVARLMAPPRREAGGRLRWLDRPAVSWSCLVLVNAALMNTLTRSAWLGLMSGVLGLIWILKRRWLFAVPAAAILFVVLAPVPVMARVLSIANLSDESTYDRLCMIEAGLRMSAEHPFVGVGPNVAENRYPIYRHPTASRLNVPHLHNSYLQLAAERGIPALLVYLLLLGVAIRAAWVADRA
jgi:putative inorganic carbon (HCO3(-)) transporter